MKKYIALSMICLSACLWQNAASAQLAFFLETKIEWPTPGFSDGKVFANLVGNYPNPVEYHIAGFDGVDYDTLVVTDSLTGLNETFFNSNFHPIYIDAIDPSLDLLIAQSVYFTGYFPFVDMELTCDTLESSFFSSDCEGFLNAQTNLTYGPGDITVEWREHYADTINTDVLSPWDALNQVNLCDGMYSIIVNAQCYTMFYLGSTLDDSPAFDVEIFTTPTGSSLCTGTALADANGTMGPLLYTWDIAAIPASSASNLCADLYTMTVTNGNLDSVDVVYAIVDSSNYYYDPAIIYPADDTLVFLIENCLVDYSVAIDSVTINNIYFPFSDVMITFTFWQGGTPFNVSGTSILEVPEDSDFLVDVTLFCPTKSINADFLKYQGRHGEVLSVDETGKIPALLVYPNPATGLVHIEGPGIAQVKILNMLGEHMLTTVNTTINVSGLSAGMYILIASDEKGSALGEQRLIVE